MCPCGRSTAYLCRRGHHWRVSLLCSLAGYALARIHFPGRNFIFLAVLATMMIPGVVLLIPRFIILKQSGLLATYQGGILPIVVDAFVIFLMKQFFESIPGEVKKPRGLMARHHFKFSARRAADGNCPTHCPLHLAFQGTWNELDISYRARSDCAEFVASHARFGNPARAGVGQHSGLWAIPCRLAPDDLADGFGLYRFQRDLCGKFKPFRSQRIT